MMISRSDVMQLDADDPIHKGMMDNSEFDYTYKPLQYPKDEDGFVKSFSLDQEDEIREAFEKYGVVVIRDVLSEEECQKSVDEVWDFLERHYEKIKRDDVTTWEHWPSLKHLGILGNEPILSKQLCDNRQNPKIHKAFSILFGTEKLFVEVSRASMMRPTKGILWKEKNEKGEEEEKIVDKPEWATLSEWIHWDMSPWTGKTTTYGFEVRDRGANWGYSQLKVQGILSLVDCHEEDGGFHVIPGFHKHIRGWANKNAPLFEKNKSGDTTTVQVPKDDEIRHDVQKMPIRKGSILIWHSALPHGTYPNASNKGRCIQYLKMAPVDDKSVKPWLSKRLLPLKEGFQLTELGEKVFGFKAW